MEEGRKERNCRKLSPEYGCDTKLSWFVKTAEANVGWVDELNDEVEREGRFVDSLKNIHILSGGVGPQNAAQQGR